MNSRRYSKFFAGLVTSLIVFSLFISPAIAAPGDTTRVSVSSGGVQGNDHSSVYSISADGRYVAFLSLASNLDSGDTNGVWDVFVRDTQTNTTARVSLDSSGAQGNGESTYAFISADGRYVAFSSWASNLVSGDTNEASDVFVRDTVANTTARVSINSSGVEGNSTSFWPSISADGRYVAFLSNASNLVSGDTNGARDVFVRDTVANTTKRVSINSSGVQGNSDSSYASVPSISADGRYVAFDSYASNLDSGDTNGRLDVFVRDTQTNTTTRVSLASSGVQGNSHSYTQSISANGRYVAFMSYAENLVSGDTNGAMDVFVRDMQTNTTTRVSLASSGVEGNSASFGSSISADGRYVAFDSNASNLVSGDTNEWEDVFVRDTVANTTTRVSVDSSGAEGNSISEIPSISADGRYVAFNSSASNLVSGDTNEMGDVFVHEMGGTSTYTVFGRVTDGSSNGIFGVSISDGAGHTASTNSSGNYTLSGLEAGTHTITPTKNGYIFSPASRTVSVPPDTSGQDFTGVAGSNSPTPFLDLPFDYGGSVSAFVKALQNWNQSGRVNSWFDHKYPNYGYNNGTGIWLYNGNHTENSYWAGTAVLCYDTFCYDGHNGIDFAYQDPQPEVTGDQPLSIHPAASGTVAMNPKTDCVKGNYSSGCGGYGNYVVVYHPNGYFTLYGHLASVNVIKVIKDATITPADMLGVMGSTGNSGGTHLHFGVYRDNGNQQWDGESIDKPVDPYGWKMSEVDPWVASQGLVSTRLWLYDPDQQISFAGNTGTVITDPTNRVEVNIPPDTFIGQVTLELSLGPVAGASAQLRSGGQYFQLKLLEGQMGSLQNSTLLHSDLSLILPQPITLAITYTDTDVLHLDATHLALYHWDNAQSAWQPLTTTLDPTNHLASAQTQELGDFDLQAPLLCPSDSHEPDDSFFAGEPVSTDGTLMSRVFDIAQDKDWFKLDVTTGTEYTIQTTNLVPGVDTALEIYDTDGVTLLASNDNGGGGNASSLTWQAPQDGLYFARVVQASGSSFGCGSTYNFAVTVVDTTAPTVVSIIRVNANPTNLASVDFTVTFSEPMTGVGMADFSLTKTGTILGESLDNVSGGPTIYTVSVNTGTGNGTMRLDIPNTATITDLIGNSLDGLPYTGGETYLVVKTAPVLITPLDSVVLHYNRPTFDWSDFPGAVGYNLQVSKSTSFSTTILNVTVNGATNSQYVPTKDLSSNATLYWRVRAKLSARKYSDWSQVFSLHTGNPPSVPKLSAPADKALVTTQQPLFDWANSTVPTGEVFLKYQIQIATDSVFASIVDDQYTTSGDINDSDYTPSILLNRGITYYWRVRSWNADLDFSAWTAARSVRIAYAPPNSLAPGNVVPGAADNVHTKRPSFTWDSVIGATNYTVEVSTSSAFSTKAINATATANSYTHTADLAANKLYYWRVKANGPNGPSLYSEVRTFTTGNPPSVPTLSAPANNTLVTTTSPLLNWNNSTLPAGTTFTRYEIQTATNNAFTTDLVTADMSGIANSQHTPPALMNGIAYYWRVRAVGQMGAIEQYSGWSLVRSVRIVYAGPTLLLPANGATGVALKPTFTWNATAGATSYNLQVSKYSTFSPLVINKTVTTPTYIHTLNLTAGTTYYWRVRINGLFGPGMWSLTFSFSTP